MVYWYYVFYNIFFAGGILGILVSNGNVINDKISMYEQENKIIENQIDAVVTNYMDYEQNTFDKCSAESMITLIDMYPELKSDRLISEQINVYLDNNKEIKSFKKAQINQKDSVEILGLIFFIKEKNK